MKIENGEGRNAGDFVAPHSHLHSEIHFLDILALGESSSRQVDALDPCYNRARSRYHWAEGGLWEAAL